MSNHRQSVRSFPSANQPYLLEYGTYTVNLEEILIQIKSLTTSKLKIQATRQIMEHLGFFQDHFDSFQDPCLNLHKFNIFGCYLAVICLPKQVSTIKFQISQPIVHQQVHCDHLWANLVCFQKHTKRVVTTDNRWQQHTEIHTRGDHTQVPTLCQKFSPVTSNICEVITKKCTHWLLSRPSQNTQKASLTSTIKVAANWTSYNRWPL